ncbi:MAG: hypothetical protein M1829_003551 [Trizodia sp. TS-e1964]|nr:MAG: hypothetical protein M1829_003551 [Trizodia sp. TS-e1964]
MSSCFGSRKSRNSDTDPLLPQYEDDTVMQRRLHQKLHSYQMVRALTRGFMPSTEQLVINLRTLLASDVLNPDDAQLSVSGQELLKHSKQFLKDFIELLRDKNREDQIQDFIWFLSRSDVSLDTRDIVNTASNVRAKADAKAAYESLRTVGSLLLTNSDFRLFLSDLNTIARQVFSDAAFTLSTVAQEAGKQISPPENDKLALKNSTAKPGPAPSAEDLNGQITEVSQVLTDGATKVSQRASASLEENVSGEQKETLLHRLKDTVLKLRRRNDYSDSVSTLSRLIVRYSEIYSRAADSTISTVQDSVHPNVDLERAVKNFWSFISSFGDQSEWDELQAKFKIVMDHSQKDPNFEGLMDEVANSVQKMLTDPNFFESAGNKIDELREKSKEVGKESSLRKDIDGLLVQAKKTLTSVTKDQYVSRVLGSALKLIGILSPNNAAVNKDLIDDLFRVFLPLLIQSVQYIPIPRLEISVPEIDLLLENLILEPGRTINDSSFLPFRLRAETHNDFEIRKAKFRTHSSLRSLVTLKAEGMSIRSEEVGFWLRAHKGLLRYADEGIASFELDERGLDIHVDVEIGKDRLENVLSLRDVRVKIHKFSYTLRKSKLACLAWFFKPFLRPILRKVLERQIARAIADGFHAANRELLYARERLRATRISDPQDIRKFIRAIITRLTPEDDPDLYTRAGVTAPTSGVFSNVYAPGSVVKMWNDEAARAGGVIEDRAADGWRNDVFEVHAQILG